MCDIIRKPTVSMPRLRGGGDVLRGDVGLGAVRRDAHDGRAGRLRRLEVVDRSDARQQKCGDSADFTTPATDEIHSRSVWAPNP